MNFWQMKSGPEREKAKVAYYSKQVKLTGSIGKRIKELMQKIEPSELVQIGRRGRVICWEGVSGKSYNMITRTPELFKQSYQEAVENELPR
jgi:hypothetical protein